MNDVLGHRPSLRHRNQDDFIGNASKADIGEMRNTPAPSNENLLAAQNAFLQSQARAMDALKQQGWNSNHGSALPGHLQSSPHHQLSGTFSIK